jgi:hypothetical protein
MPHRSNGSSRLAAIVKQQCPRCLRGQVFATLFRMHEQCPVYRLPFEREPGYFTGAMYLSYGVARKVSRRGAAGDRSPPRRGVPLALSLCTHTVAAPRPSI